MSFSLLALVFIGVSAETNGGDSKWLRTARRLQEAEKQVNVTKPIQFKQHAIIKVNNKKFGVTIGRPLPICRDFKGKDACAANPNCKWRKKVRPVLTQRPVHNGTTAKPLRPIVRPVRLSTTNETLVLKPSGRRMQEEDDEDCECVEGDGLGNYLLETDCRSMSESDCLLFDGVCKWHHYLFDDESDCNYTPKCYEADYFPTAPVCKKNGGEDWGEGADWDPITEENCSAGYIARGEGWPRKMCDATIYTPDHDGVGQTKWWQWPNFLNPRNNELHVCEWREEWWSDNDRCGVVNINQYQ